MHDRWLEFLQQQGAHLDNGTVDHFGDAAAERVATRDRTVVCDLSQHGIIKASGDDAQTFLHNLFSSDVNALDTRHALHSSFNTAKGRMLATLLLWRDESAIYLQLPRPLVEPIRKKLSMYVLRSKVKLEDVSDNLVCLGLAGPDAASVLQQHFQALPQQTLDVASHGDNQLIRLDTQRFQLILPLEQATAMWQPLAGTIRPAGSSCWDWLTIRAGIAVVMPQTQEAFVPQMANLDLTGGINFKKGCYPGQEVVARMHYLGKAKRRMYLAHVDSNTAPLAGDELFSADHEGQPPGQIANAAPAPDGGYDVLAVVPTSSHEANAVRWGGPEGPPLQFLPLPYALP